MTSNESAYVPKKGDKWMSGDIVREVRPVPPDCIIIGKDAYYFQGIEGKLVGLSLERIKERDEKLIKTALVNLGLNDDQYKELIKVFASVDSDEKEEERI